jgi:hypothetical protein
LLQGTKVGAAIFQLARLLFLLPLEDLFLGQIDIFNTSLKDDLPHYRRESNSIGMVACFKAFSIIITYFEFVNTNFSKMLVQK